MGRKLTELSVELEKVNSFDSMRSMYLENNDLLTEEQMAFVKTKLSDLADVIIRNASADEWFNTLCEIESRGGLRTALDKKFHKSEEHSLDEFNILIAEIMESFKK